MSFWKNTLVSLGVGSAEIDAELDSDTYRAGDTVSGLLHIQGGNQDQNVDQITLDLVTEYVEKVDDKKVTKQAIIDEFALHEPFTIAAGEKRVDPFSFQLSPDTPVTITGTKVWVQTGLDIKQAVDPTDKDASHVPHG
jgi:sporulation-control protein